MSGNKNNNKITGNLGEDIAVKYLKNKGFLIQNRNYTKKYGEIDIVARGTNVNDQTHVSYETSDRIHFIEVKSVSYETKDQLNWAVTHETWRPEEQVTAFKLNQIRKAGESWILENGWTGNVQIDVIAVRMVPREKYATVKYIPNVIAE